MDEAKEYALRHLPAHLAAAGRTSRLYELARHPAFPRQQAASFPSEPRIELSAPRTALAAAAACNDAVSVAEFTLRHVARTVELASESPIVAAQSGALNRAWELANRPDVDDRSLWHLLLAWDLRVRGYPNQSARTLERLLRGRPTVIQTGEFLDQRNWKNMVAVTLVGILAERITPTLRQVIAALLPESQRDTPLTPEQPQEPGRGMTDNRASITTGGLRQALAGDVVGARKTLNRIRLDRSCYRIESYQYVIHTLREQGHESSAVTLVAELLRPVDEVDELALQRIRACAALCGMPNAVDQPAALALLADLKTTAAALDDIQHRFHACHDIAAAVLAVTGTYDHRTLVTEVMGTPDESAQATIAITLCHDLAATGQVPAALELVADLPQSIWRSYTTDAYAMMTRALADQGDLDSAWNMAERITIPNWERTVEGDALAARADAFAHLVVGAIRAGDTASAEAAFGEILRYGSGTEGDTEKWWRAVRTAILTLVPHHLMRGTSGRFPVFYGILTKDDAARLDSAADAVASENIGDSAAELLRIEEPYWRAITLAHLATRGDTHRLVELALDSAAAENRLSHWLHACREIAKTINPLRNKALTNRLMTAIDSRATSADVALYILKTALHAGDLAHLPRALTAAADQPVSAYGLCVLLAKHNKAPASEILPVVRDI